MRKNAFTLMIATCMMLACSTNSSKPKESSPNDVITIVNAEIGLKWAKSLDEKYPRNMTENWSVKDWQNFLKEKFGKDCRFYESNPSPEDFVNYYELYEFDFLAYRLTSDKTCEPYDKALPIWSVYFYDENYEYYDKKLVELYDESHELFKKYVEEHADELKKLEDEHRNKYPGNDIPWRYRKGGTTEVTVEEVETEDNY